MTTRLRILASALIIGLISLSAARPALAQIPRAAGQDVLVEDVEIRGNRRIPRESILYYVQSKPQDRFDQALAQIGRAHV